MTVYFVQDDLGVGPIKIGYTSTDVASRVRALQTGSPQRLRVLAVVPGTKTTEAALHRRHSRDRMSGEWFAPTPRVLAEVEQAKRTGSTPRPGGEVDWAAGIALVLICMLGVSGLALLMMFFL